MKDGTPLLRDNHSDVNSQEDDKVEERKEQMGLRKNLKALASTFVSKSNTQNFNESTVIEMPEPKLIHMKTTTSG